MGAGAAAELLAPVAPAAEVPAHHPHITEHGLEYEDQQRTAKIAINSCTRHIADAQHCQVSKTCLHVLNSCKALSIHVLAEVRSHLAHWCVPSC